MININQPNVKFALHAVRQSSMLVRQVRKELVAASITKDDRSPVTVADFASQAVIAYLLSKTFPNDLLIAEEDSAVLRQNNSQHLLDQVVHYASLAINIQSASEVCDLIDLGKAESAARFWTLDPIDGTKGFLRGDQYAVALALIQDGIVQVAALGCPELENSRRSSPDGAGSLVIAARGQGAWFTSLIEPGDFQPLKVSVRSDPSAARLLRSFESGHTNTSQIDLFQQQLGIRSASVLMDSQAKYAMLAAGEGDLLLRLLSPSKPDYREKIWDQAAGSLILEEAGGQITDLDGKQLDFTHGRQLTANRGILASNGNLHKLALQALKHMGA